MSVSHHRQDSPGAIHHAAPIVYNHHESRSFSVLRMAPQYPGGPENVVCAGSEAVAQFWDGSTARSYCDWRNKSCPKKSPTPTVS